MKSLVSIIVERLESECGYLQTGGAFTTIASVRKTLGERSIHKMLPAVFVAENGATKEGSVADGMREQIDVSVIIAIGRFDPNGTEYTDEQVDEMKRMVKAALALPWRPGQFHLSYESRSDSYSELGFSEHELLYSLKNSIPYNSRS